MSIQTDKACKVILERGGTIIGIEGAKVQYLCCNKHEICSRGNDILRGHGCIFCKRAGRTPRKPISLPVGTRNGDLEVISELGVINHFSMVRVRNIKTFVEKDMTPSDFKRTKVKLLDAQGIFEVCRRNGLARKNASNPKSSSHTWGDVLSICEANKFVFLHPVIDSEPVYKVRSKQWSIRCFCGSIFTPMLNNVLNGGVRGCGCIKSLEQREIGEFLVGLGFRVDIDRRDIIAPYELDLYLPDIKMAVEYSGLYWHGELKCGLKARKSHVQKWQMCRERGIRLITIFQDEWLLKRNVTEGFLRAILGKQSHKIGARKLQVKIVDAITARGFLINHLQGYAPGVSIGLWDKETLLALAVFARPNASRARKQEDGLWELARYCVHPQHKVMGGLSRLISTFVTEEPTCSRLLSYSDNRWSEGGMYRAVGFELKKINPPSYWYFGKPTKGIRVHRYKFRKQEALRLFGLSDGTEWEINSKNGLDRIWDCGSMRWEMTFTPPT
jgi:hypothetical protein